VRWSYSRCRHCLPGRWTLAQLRQAFDLADTDSDGVLSRAEYEGSAVAR